MIFPPYIAPPCSLPCCRPSSSSIPRYSIRGRSSFSLSPVVGCRSMTPPRPPPVTSSYDHQAQRQQKNAKFHSVQSSSASMSNQMNNGYSAAVNSCMMKPALSMPGGLAQTPSSSQIRSTSSGDNLHRTSQPNLMRAFSSSGGNVGVGGDNDCPNGGQILPPKRDTQSISNLATTTTATTQVINSSTNSNPTYASAVDRSSNSIERRTTPYYYNELFSSASVFDSNLNLRYPLVKDNNANDVNSNHINGHSNGIVVANSSSSSSTVAITTTNGGRRSATAAAAAAAAGASVLNSLNTSNNLTKGGRNSSSTPTAVVHHHQRHYRPNSIKTKYDVNCNGRDDSSAGICLGNGGVDCGGDGSAETLCDENGLFGPIPAARRSTLSSLNNNA